MALDEDLRRTLALPAVCAPMMLVSGPELVVAACKAGIMAGLPAHNARDPVEFDSWLARITDELQRHREICPGTPLGPVAVNVSAVRRADEIQTCLDSCRRHGVKFIISAMANPAALVKRAHDIGASVFHDVTTVRHAYKAIEAGVDALVCIGAGGGGHSGTISPLALIPKIRSMFDGTIVLAGCAATGAAIRAAEVLGADLCYLGTRFIATQEARAPAGYKAMLVASSAQDLIFTPRVSGLCANWLKGSLRAGGLDPDDLPAASGPRNYDHLPAGMRPWRDYWSAGQGVELIDDIPTVAELVRRLRDEYSTACNVPDMRRAASR